MRRGVCARVHHLRNCQNNSSDAFIRLQIIYKLLNFMGIENFLHKNTFTK